MGATASLIAVLSVALQTQTNHSAPARDVNVQGGNVVITMQDGRSRSVSSAGRDSQPSLSADGSEVVFTRSFEGGTPASDIWIASSQFDWKPTRLVRPPAGSRWRNYAQPKFSPDSSRVNFLDTDLAVAIHGLYYFERATGKVAFFAPALRYWVVLSGTFRGDLVLEQNPMLLVGGRLEIYYLFNPAAKQVDIVGLSEENVKFFLSPYQDDEKN